MVRLQNAVPSIGILCLFVVITAVSNPATGCDGSPTVRLVDGPNSCSGRVEVYHDGQWGTVCDDGWDLRDASVVCKQLVCGKVLSAPSSATFGQGTGPIWLDDVSCLGSEPSLTECAHPNFGKHNCAHGEDAGVVCKGSPTVRLVNGPKSCSGRVEVYHDGQWGTVCDDGWDLRDASVVCKQVVCGKALSAPSSATFGQGTGPIWLDDVSCLGSEPSLTECAHPNFGKHNCAHGEDAGVVCEGISDPEPQYRTLVIRTMMSSDADLADKNVIDEILKQLETDLRKKNRAHFQVRWRNDEYGVIFKHLQEKEGLQEAVADEDCPFTRGED